VSWFGQVVRILQLPKNPVPFRVFYPFLVLGAAFTPCQGLPNFIVYWYPKYAKARLKNPSAGRRVWLQKALAAIFHHEARHDTRETEQQSPLKDGPGATTLFHAAMMRENVR
jgi:hypothetical protein